MTKSILIVDDSSSVRQVLGMTLKGASYDVVESVDGVDALQKAQGKKFNLVISDVNMPNMDGITFIKKLKTLPEHKFTPIIMLTTEGAEEKKQEGKAAGAKAWVVKPFKPEEMLKAVSLLIA